MGHGVVHCEDLLSVHGTHWFPKSTEGLGPTPGATTGMGPLAGLTGKAPPLVIVFLRFNRRGAIGPISVGDPSARGRARTRETRRTDENVFGEYDEVAATEEAVATEEGATVTGQARPCQGWETLSVRLLRLSPAR